MNPTIQKQCRYSNEELEARKRRLIDIAKEVCPEFVIDERNKQLLADLFNYFNGIEGKFNLNKGLWLLGDLETGKTTLMHIFSEYLKQEYRGFKVFSCAKISNDYALKGDLDLYEYNRNGYIGNPVHMCFDELGREAIPANYFGQKLNVMQQILHTRYNIWRVDGVKTYVTTNCDPVAIETLYGDFIRDRTREMFNVIPMVGPTRRK